MESGTHDAGKVHGAYCLRMCSALAPSLQELLLNEKGVEGLDKEVVAVMTS